MRQNKKLRAYVKSGRAFGPWENRPRVPHHLRWVWEAFMALQTCRPEGMSLRPIPWTAIRQWAEAKGVDHVERFERLIRAMDRAFMEFVNEEGDTDG